MKGLKTGGRQVGSKNKIGSEAKQIIEAFCVKNYADLQTNFDTLTPKEKLVTLQKFSEFFITKGADEIILSDEQVNFIIEKLRKELSA